MTTLERIIWNTLWLGLGAFLIIMILAAPVMREQATGTINATDYFSDDVRG